MSPPRRTATPPEGRTPREAARCPVQSKWRYWGLDDLLRIADPRKRQVRPRDAGGRRRWHRIDVTWTPGAGDHSRLNRRHGRIRDPIHLHATLVLARERVHIDWITGRGWGPGHGFDLAVVSQGGKVLKAGLAFGTTIGLWGNTFAIRVVLRSGRLLRVSEGRPVTVDVDERPSGKRQNGSAR